MFKLPRCVVTVDNCCPSIAQGARSQTWNCVTFKYENLSFFFSICINNINTIVILASEFTGSFQKQISFYFHSLLLKTSLVLYRFH